MKERIFIVGGGTSLRGFDFSRLDNEETIAINESLFDLNNPTYFVTMDSGWISRLPSRVEEYKIFKSTSAIKYFINPRGKYGFDNQFDFVLESMSVSGFNTELLKYGDSQFSHGYNSGYCAVQLAIKLNYEKIYLLGIDMRGKRDGSHYHNKYHVRKRYDVIIQPYAKIFIQSLKELGERKNKIISCSEISRLNKVIEYVPVDEVLLKNEHPLEGKTSYSL